MDWVHQTFCRWAGSAPTCNVPHPIEHFPHARLRGGGMDMLCNSSSASFNSPIWQSMEPARSVTCFSAFYHT